MKLRWLVLLLTIASIAAAQTGGRGGGGGQNNPPSGSASVRPPGSSLGTIRLGAQDEKIWFGWHVGIPSTAFRGLTFSDAAAKADAAHLEHAQAPALRPVLVHGLLEVDDTVRDAVQLLVASSRR